MIAGTAGIPEMLNTHRLRLIKDGFTA